MTLNSNSYLCGLSLYTRIDDNEEHHLQNFDNSTPSGDMCATSGAQEGKGFSRGQSVIVRIGAGLPSNFNVGGGYQFTPFLDAKAGFGTSGKHMSIRIITICSVPWLQA